MAILSNTVKRRFPGERWQLVHGPYFGLERFAFAEAQRVLQAQVPYVVEWVDAASDPQQGDEHWLVVGTAAGNPLIARLAAAGQLELPNHPEGYGIAVLDAPWRPGRRVVAIGARDPRGLIHGVADFAARDLGVEVNIDEAWDAGRPPTLPDLLPGSRCSAPRIADRGVWTWGYVMYDYRRFLDSMARLRFNLITIWNDVPPVNAAEVIAYAHDRGIRVVLGFHWGWGLDGLDLGNPEHIAWVEQRVLAQYEREYAHLPHDGIYFQTVTEHRNLHLGQAPTAKLACDLANRVGRKLLDRHPGLWIQFGLHATSIGDQYHHLEALDPRITLTWEDAGVIPYSYPAADRQVRTFGAHPPLNPTVDATIAYSLKLAALRGGQEFAIVPKGFTCLRWGSEFENHGPFLLGERNRRYIRTRGEQRQPTWDVQNGLWMANYPAVVRLFREVLAAGPRRVTATALIEDGMLEETIQPAAALFANLLWDPDADPALLPRLAHSSYYRMA